MPPYPPTMLAVLAMRHAFAGGGADLTCVRLAVRPLAPPVYPAGYLRQVGHMGGPAVRGCDDLTTISVFVISASYVLDATEMEKKQGFFSALREEVARGLTPARARGRSRSRSESPRRGPSPVMELLLLPRRRWRRRGMASGPAVPRSGSLAPLMEGPDSGEGDGDEARKERGWGQWVKGQLSWAPSVSTSAAASCRSSDLRLLLGVMAAPLAPIHVCSTDPLPHLSIKDTPIVSAPILSFLHYHILPSFMVVLNIELYGVAKIPALSSRLDLGY
ncbi:hypothetical protein B296_00057162 [Ensete ventricosum]|uniref:Uncharacterized protein n=1 Tax=Ensete ventricosum TaxID=4639 RepID=A0A426XLA2_ENSVE|nr:hypothetical protein B296_00057162 [Ensete ventricosum]